MKLSLKKQQEREIVYVTVHCVLNEKHYNAYYSFLMQKFCEFDRRFKVKHFSIHLKLLINIIQSFCFTLDDFTVSYMG